MARPKDPLAGKPSAYETGRSHARAGRSITEMPFDPNAPDAAEFRRGYDDASAEKAKADGEKAGADARAGAE